MARVAASRGASSRAPKKQSLSSIIGASSCGTLIEWYDFYLYGPAASWRAAGRSFLLLFLVAIAGCGCAPEPPRAPLPPAAMLAPLPPDTFSSARIVVVHPKLQCVTYARRESGIDLRGNAGDWWSEAEGRYARGAAPEPGAVLVFKPYRQSPGHLAVVTNTANPRVIVVDHADWLNDGNIHKATPVLDVSEQGDWSQVRVWYSPGVSWGLRVYAIHGFIYPAPRMASADVFSDGS